MKFFESLKHNPKRREIFYGFLQGLSDFIFIGLSFYLAFLLKFSVERYETIGNNYIYYFLYSALGIFVIIIIFITRKLYNLKNLYKGMGENEGIVTAVIISIFIIIISNYYFNRDGYQLSRIWIIYSTVFTIILLLVSRFIIKRLFFKLLSKSGVKTNLLIIGCNEEANRIAKTLESSKIESINVVGFLYEKDNDCKAGSLLDTFTNNKINNKLADSNIIMNNNKNKKILGNIKDLENILKKYNVNRIIISTPHLKYFDILELLDRVNDTAIEVQMSPSLFEFSVSRMKMFDYMGFPLIQIQKVRMNLLDKFLKFLIDLVIGSFLFIIFLLVFPVIGILIKIDSKGPIIYTQERYGKNFKKIRIYKFRTMRHGADKEKEIENLISSRETGFKIKDDPRITRVGKILRKYSIDELPQVLNVIKGELSVIGPRPITVKEAEMLKDWEKKRMIVNQGITGLWQVSGRSDISYEERMRLDLYYIQNWSVWLDLKILVLTILKVFGKTGAY